MKSKRSRKQGQRSPQSGHGPAAPAVSPITLSPRRKWLFRLVATVALPLIVLGGAELLLRLSGFGFDPHFFKQTKVGGKDCYVANADFGLSFFPRKQARAPGPIVMPVTKPPGTFRIFIFGESAALGDPRPNYGAGSFLEVLLAERYPKTKFEVVNTGITAINSHAILPIARECSHHEGDLWLIYMGNNEMVGPFGAASVFGRRAPPLALVRTQLQLQRTHLAQFVAAVSQNLQKGKTGDSSWGGMEMFMQNQVPPNDPRKQRVYENFDQNLDEILRVGLASGAKIVLSTVAVNLKDCPPFGSVTAEDLPRAQRADYEQNLQRGVMAEAQGQFAEACSNFQQAAEISPQAAEAQFRLGKCLMTLTNSAAAQTHFLKAVDTDTLPFRADSRINGTIRAAARKFSGASLVLCDAAEILGAKSPSGIPGDEFFYEHVHPNPMGSYELALAWAENIEKVLSPALKDGARPLWAPQSECEQRLGLTDWNRLSILEEVLGRIQRPPFSGQIDHTQKVAGLQAAIAKVKQGLTSDAATQAREIYLQAIRRAPENFRLHENYAEFLEATHELEAAIAEREKVCELISPFYFPYYALGVDLKEAGELSKAREVLLKAAAIKPDEGDVRLELGIVSARQGEWEAARKQMEAARQYNPNDPKIHLYLGEVLWKQDRRSEALASLREAIRLNPSDWQPHFRLASDLAQEGDLAGAATEYQEVLRLNPGHVKTRLGLAAVLLDAGQQPEALRQLDEALRLEPENQSALELKRRIRGM